MWPQCCSVKAFTTLIIFKKKSTTNKIKAGKKTQKQLYHSAVSKKTAQEKAEVPAKKNIGKISDETYRNVLLYLEIDDVAILYNKTNNLSLLTGVALIESFYCM